VIDHRIVKAPYIRIEKFKKGINGDNVYQLDFRLTQPNKKYIDPIVLHSLEHYLLVGLQKYMESFVTVAPMGCQTGMYLVFLNECDAFRICDCIEKILQEMMLSTEVPLSDIVHCGQATFHDTDKTKLFIQKLLDERNNWLTVF
jgi:S-ribosylhomocysteine lyase